jgi:hypothetical protein
MEVSVEFSYIWLPKSVSAPPGLVYADAPDDWRRYRYALDDRMFVMAPQTGDSHAAFPNTQGDMKGLCATGPWDNAETLAEGRPEQVALRVTCKFCQARLVHAGVLDPDDAQAYAKYYGTLAAP